MANAIFKNWAFIDTVSVGVTFDAIVPKLHGLLLTPSAANARIIIKTTDTNGTIIMDFKAESANESRYLDWSGMGGLQISQTIFIFQMNNVQTVMLYGEFFLQAGKAL